MENFNDYCKEFIKNELQDYEGVNTYACDLANLLTEEINSNCTATFDRELSKKCINLWWDEAEEYHEYEKSNFGEALYNPFENPEAFVVCMIIAGVESLLSQVSYIDKNWNDEIELTQDVINTILQEVNNKNVEW